MALNDKELEDTPLRRGQLFKCRRYPLPCCCITQNLLGIANGGSELREVLKCLVEAPYQAAELYLVCIESLIVFLDSPSCTAVAIKDFPAHLHIVVCSGCGVVDSP